MLCPNCGAEVGSHAILCEKCLAQAPIQPAQRASRQEKRTRIKVPLPTPKFLLVLFFPIAWLYLYGLPLPARRYPPGQIAPDEPLQSAIRNSKPWKLDRVTVYPLATFQVRARVLLRSRFYFIDGSDIAPVDLTLAWGPLSDQAIIDQIEFSHMHRFYAWKARHPPLSPEEVNSHVANMHLIPANPELLSRLRKVRVGDVVRLSGYLVKLTRDDGWHWQSSLTRTDSGNGACELVWVEKIRIE